MVTFRKDIHLGRRVPMTPKDENQCMFVSLSDEGLAVDKYGRKWKLQPWGDMLAVPVITLTDVTVTEYPSLVGKTEAVWLVSLSHEDSEAEIWYKIVKNGDEPETYSKYVEAFQLKDNGNYQIVCKAKKEGVIDSEVIRSDTFKVSRLVVEETYYKPIITAFSYSDFSADGEAKLPTFTYSQAGERRYTDGYVQALTPIVEGATCYFWGMDGITPSTGGLTVAKNYLPQRKKLGTVYATVTMNGVISDTAQCDVYQLAAAKQNNSVVWLIQPSSPVNSGTLLTIGENILAQSVYDETAEIRYYYKEGTRKVYFDTSISIDKDIVVGAEASETTYYKSASIEKQILVNGETRVYIGWGRTDADFLEVINQPGGDGAVDLITPSNPHYLDTLEQLQRSTTDLNSQIMNPDDGVIWMAYLGSQRPTVTVEQSNFLFVINEWETPLDQWGDPIKMPVHDGSSTTIYSMAYTIFEGNATLKSVTF